MDLKRNALYVASIVLIFSAIMGVVEILEEREGTVYSAGQYCEELPTTDLYLCEYPNGLVCLRTARRDRLSGLDCDWETFDGRDQ